MNLLRAIGNLFRFDRTNWKAVVLCFVGALVFWVFNAFNKNHTANIRFPLHFEYNRDKYVQVKELPHQVNINVSGNGWDLFRNQWGLKQPELTIPLERPTEVKKIVGASLPPLLQHQLGKLHINYLITDTLRLQIDEKDFHRFKVVVDHSNLSFRKGFGKVSPIVILPDSVTLEGPKSILHSMSDSITVSISGKQINQNFNEEVELLPGNEENIKRNPPLIKIMIEVGPVMIVERRLKLTDHSQKNLLVDSLSAWFQIPTKRKEEFDLISKEMKAVINKKKFSEEGEAIPHILKMPSYAELVKIDTLKAN
jgi:YbbR domain-containing protein